MAALATHICLDGLVPGRTQNKKMPYTSLNYDLFEVHIFNKKLIDRM